MEEVIEGFVALDSLSMYINYTISALFYPPFSPLIKLILSTGNSWGWVNEREGLIGSRLLCLGHWRKNIALMDHFELSDAITPINFH